MQVGKLRSAGNLHAWYGRARGRQLVEEHSEPCIRHVELNNAVRSSKNGGNDAM